MNLLNLKLTGPQARTAAAQAIQTAPDGTVVILKDTDRTLEQNDLLWPYLRGFSRQVPWIVNGVEIHMSEDEWKDVLTAAFHKETRMAKAFDGSGVVMLGASTSQMGKRIFSEFMEFVIAAAAEREVQPVFRSPHWWPEC